MAAITMKQLLEAGVHFGHQVNRWNPKMEQYIFGAKNGIYIIDLQKTVGLLAKAYDFLRELTARGGSVVFVGTKKQAQESIVEQALRCEMFYVKERWIGGALTNFNTVSKSMARLKKLKQMKEDGSFDNLTKKEISALSKETARLEKNIGGIVDMKKTPDVMFVVDPKREKNAIKEAIKLEIPVIALIDTNGNPDEIDYPIPGNDDAIKSISLIVSAMAQAALEGRQIFKESGVTAADAVQPEVKEEPAGQPEKDKPEPAKTIEVPQEKELEIPEEPAKDEKIKPKKPRPKTMVKKTRTKK
ncbi:MAG: 30S ribosomal protein S2 [Candidatus Omnitrophica bacterium]|nr:30S ribosomal protein S2 [Candidatus Omnitrophota bacterium]